MDQKQLQNAGEWFDTIKSWPGDKNSLLVYIYILTRLRESQEEEIILNLEDLSSATDLSIADTLVSLAKVNTSPYVSLTFSGNNIHAIALPF